MMHLSGKTQTNRRGLMLYQMLIVATVGSALVGSAVFALHQVLGVDRQSRAATRDHLARQRLALQFRDDVLRSSQVTILPTGDGCRIESARGVVEYKIDKSVVARRREGTEIGQDRFSFRRGTGLFLRRAGTGVRFEITWPRGRHPKNPGGVRRLVIEAWPARVSEASSA